MPITLSDFLVGETTYVAKLNANNQSLRDYLDQYFTAQANLSSSALSVGAMQNVMFGTVAATFSETSYATQAIGADLIVSAGTAWAPSQQLVVQLTSGATVSMSGRAAGTYYLNAVNGSPLNAPVISTAAQDPLYSFVWNGSGITALTRLAVTLRPLARGPYQLAYASSLFLDWSFSDTIRVTLTGNATITACTGGYDGMRCMLEVTQDATGGRTLSASAGAVHVGSDVTLAIDTTANRRTRVGLVYNRPSAQYDLVAVARGF